MTLSKLCKSSGLKGGGQALADHYDVPVRTLYDWTRTKPKVVRGLIIGLLHDRMQVPKP